VNMERLAVRIMPARRKGTKKDEGMVVEAD
jgi:hypothetical protein